MAYQPFSGRVQKDFNQSSQTGFTLVVSKKERMRLMEQQERYRHELKHSLNAADCEILSRKLRLLMKPDLYAGPNGIYHIRSLYFDNPDDKAVREKIDDVNDREKFRIRIYNLDDRLIKLEKKRKKNGLCQKVATVLSKEQCEAILRGNWKPESNGLQTELYAKMRWQGLRPKTIVDYKREAFCYNPGNIRVTIDKDVRSGLLETELFNPNLPTVPVIRTGEAVLEVKYDHFLPAAIADLLQLGTRRTGAFSKYVNSRIYG